MRGVLDIIGWSFVAAVTAWGITLYWAKLRAGAKPRRACRRRSGTGARRRHGHAQ